MAQHTIVFQPTFESHWFLEVLRTFPRTYKIATLSTHESASRCSHRVPSTLVKIAQLVKKMCSQQACSKLVNKL
jgi:hypothetical protein